MSLAIRTSHRHLLAVFVVAATLALPAGAALVDNGDGTVTDTATHKMWAKDTNLFATLYNGLADNAAKDQFINAILALTPTYTDPVAGSVTLSASDWELGGDPNAPADHTATGLMTIFGAQAFVTWLNASNWAGYNDWHLPDARPINGVAFDTGNNANSFYDGTKDQSHNFANSPSDLTHLYYDQFQLNAQYDTAGVVNPILTYGVAQTVLLFPGDNLPNLTPFLNFEEAEYFTRTYDSSTGIENVWTNNFGTGVQHLLDRGLIDLGGGTWVYVGSALGHALVVRDATEAPSAALGTIDAFGEQTVGTTSAAQAVSLSNSGTAPFGIQSIAASAEFAAAHDCGTSLGAGKSCSIQVTFAPALTGTRSGTLTVTPTSGTPLTLSLTGTGIGDAPNPVLGTPQDFGDQMIHAASAPQVITLSNTGTAEFAIGSIAASGDFAVASHTCGTTLAAAGATCSISVVFTPSAAGGRSGTLTVTQASSGATVTASLAGTGISAGHLAAATGRLDFGAVAGGKVAKSSLLLINDGTEDLRVGTVSAPAAPFALSGNRCSGKLLKPGKSCKVGVKFSGSGGEEPATGTLTVSAEGLADLAVALSGRTGDPGEVAEVAAVTPDIGFGGRIVLSGKEFTSRPGKVTVGGKRAAILAWSDTAIVVTAPKLAEGSHAVVVSRKGTPGGGETTVNVHKPELSELDVTSGAPGTPVMLSGRYFGNAKSVVAFQPAAGRVVVAKPKARSGEFGLEIVVPKRVAAGEYGVVVKNPAGSSEALTFTVN